MKKTKYCLRILLLLMLVCTLTACGFVDYILYDDENAAAAFSESLEDYLTKIKEVSSSELYLEEERREYERALLDAENELRECETVEELEEIFKKHYNIIISIRTELSYVLEAGIEELYTYVSLDDYRDAEQNTIKELLKQYEADLKASDSIPDIEKLLREFKAEIYNLKTNEIYIAEELKALKQNYSEYYSKYVNFAIYRQNERDEIFELTKNFRKNLDDAKDANTATELYKAYVSAIEALPTDASLFSAEKSALISDWENTFNTFASKHSLSISSEINTSVSMMEAATSLAYINKMGADLLIIMSDGVGDSAIEDMRAAAKIYAENAIDRADYRKETQGTLDLIISQLTSSINSAETTDEILILCNSTENAFESVLTADELTAQELKTFLTDLQNRYGNDVLELPSNMSAANSYEELAAIIDYYAFYQLSGSEFLCDTFRVDILFPFKDSQWEINEVYWYCELIRSGAGLTGYFEEDSNCFVITIIPYEIASVSNAEVPAEVNRYTSLVEYGSDKSGFVARGSNFDAFPYLEYDKSVAGVWNTQQLWYSLEHEYIPRTVIGSPAEAALDRAKEILREIIYEGMSDEEKVFAIYSWFGENNKYDHDYNDFIYPEDRDHFPDVLAATLNSFHVEGALFDNLSVCCAFAKAYLLLLRIEGIESYRVFMHSYTENAIGNLGREGFGSHALVAIRMSDGKFYYSDTEQSFLHADERFVKYHQLSVSPEIHWPYNDGKTNMYKDFDFGDGASILMTEKLVYNGQSIFVNSDEELKPLIDGFAAETDKNIQISIFADKSSGYSPADTLSADTRFEYKTFSFGGLTEYIIYK